MITKKALTLWLLVVVLLPFQTGISSAEKKDTPTGKDFSGVDFKNGLLKVLVENQ